MLAAFGVDVLDPKTTPRRMWVLLERLPPDARGLGEQWSTEADLLALLIDHVANLTYVQMRAAGAKTARPKPLPRPKRQAAPRAATGAPRSADPEPARTSSWFDAAAKLSTIPGVITRGGDG